jgi:hypothetical protein
VPSAPASFACCDQCTAPPATRFGDRVFGPQPATAVRSSAADHLFNAQLCDAASAPATTPAGSLAAAHPLSAGARVSADDAMVARRRLLQAAVLRRAPDLGGISRPFADRADRELARERHPADPAAAVAAEPAWDGGAGAISASAADEADHAGFADSTQMPRTVWGTVVDVSPHVLVMGDSAYEQRFTLTPDAVAWRNRLLEPAALRLGDNVVVRLHPGYRDVADRIWANIGRVTGVIRERDGDALLVDEGATRASQRVTVPRQALGRIQVRFPILEPGFLVDIIGRRRGDELVGLIPATSQPSYPAARIPAPPLVSGRAPRVITGSAVWHEPRNEAPGVLGVSYPALDPESGCAEDTLSGARQGYARMPYLSLGSVLRVRNHCTGTDCLVPVTACAFIARLFNDRCVTCGTSPRGRIADLTMASFIALGGELERGCFNASLSIGE